MTAHSPPPPPDGPSTADGLLFLTEDRLREGVELLFFAYRDHTADGDKTLAAYGFGRAHHRAIYFIGRRPGLSVAELLEVLAVTKQSLARVLRPLIDKGFVVQNIGEQDRRRRRLFLTEDGAALERRLFAPQRARMRRAFRDAGPEAVSGFRKVLELMMNDDNRGPVLEMVAARDLPDQRRDAPNLAPDPEQQRSR